MVKRVKTHKKLGKRISASNPLRRPAIGFYTDEEKRVRPITAPTGRRTVRVAARRSPKKLKYELELWDIDESIVFKDGIPQNEEKVITENIKYILKREGLWKKGMSVVLPAGGLQILDIENGTYQYDFEVFESDGNTIAYHGTCYGHGTWFDSEKNFIVHNMIVTLRRGED